MYEISKEFSFSASHRLSGLPDNHPCSRQHGHNYIVKVTIEAPRLVDPGFVIDYRDLDPFKIYIDDIYDHQHLNQVLADINPTAENLAYHFFWWIAGSSIGQMLADTHGYGRYALKVSVSETPKTWATYDGGDDGA